MELHKTPLKSIFSVQSAITFYRIRFGDRHYGGDWHDFPELMYVEDGTHRVLVDGTLFELQAGQAILYAPNAYHTGPVSKALVDIVSFETDFEALPALCNRVLTLSGKQKQLLSRIMTQGLDHFTPIAKESGERGLTPRAETGALELMRLKNNLELLLIDLSLEHTSRSVRDASNTENMRTERLRGVTLYLKEHLGAPLSLGQIAKDCHMSVSQLKLLFRTELGCGPIAYLIALRIGEAKRMISDTSLNFTQIAERLGFGSIHHFSKRFKEKTGLSPSEYAKTVYKK